MKLFMPNKSILIVNAISVMVAFLIHLPEMIALSDMMPDEVIFPGMHWTDVFNEVFFTYLSLLLLFFLNERLFRFGDTRVNMGWKNCCCPFWSSGLPATCWEKASWLFISILIFRPLMPCCIIICIR